MNPQITHESGVDSHSPAGARVETWLNGPIKTGSPWAGLCLPPISPPGDKRSTYNFPLKSIAWRGRGGEGVGGWQRLGYGADERSEDKEEEEDFERGRWGWRRWWERLNLGRVGGVLHVCNSKPCLSWGGGGGGEWGRNDRGEVFITGRSSPGGTVSLKCSKVVFAGWKGVTSF